MAGVAGAVSAGGLAAVLAGGGSGGQPRRQGGGGAGAVAAGVLAGVRAAGCSGGAPASYRATAETCLSFGLRAIQRHVMVTAEPRACAGLSPEQVNLAVARAIREAVGPEPKALARHLADQDSTYLAPILSTIR